MARIRSIKPEFFIHEELSKLSPLIRLAFQGLWCQADKAGRLEDRPVRLKVQILPYDDVDFEAVLDALVGAKFVQRYVGPDGRVYLQIRSFLKHQRPRPDEPESQIPAPQRVTETVTGPSLCSDGCVTWEQVGKEGKGREGKEERKGSTLPRSSAQEVVDLWNQLVTSPIPKVTKLTPDRRTRIEARLRTFPTLAEWQTAITWVNGQPWCRASGQGTHPGWTATLDWLVKNDGQVQRCLERATQAPAAHPTRPYETRLDETPAVFDEPWLCRHPEPRCAHRVMCGIRSGIEARKARAQ